MHCCCAPCTCTCTCKQQWQKEEEAPLQQPVDALVILTHVSHVWAFSGLVPPVNGTSPHPASRRAGIIHGHLQHLALKLFPSSHCLILPSGTWACLNPLHPLPPIHTSIHPPTSPTSRDQTRQDKVHTYMRTYVHTYIHTSDSLASSDSHELYPGLSTCQFHRVLVLVC